MRILVIGATGTIGSHVVHALEGKHEIVPAGRHADIAVDIDDPQSIRAMYVKAGTIDAVILAAGEAVFAPFEKLTDENFQRSLHSKLMGQVNVVRYGFQALPDGGSFTLTSGILAQQPMPGSTAVSLVNAGIEGFVRAAALELPRRLRINAVSPGWVSETLEAMGSDPAIGVPAEQVAQSYVTAVEGKQTGTIISATR